MSVFRIKNYKNKLKGTPIIINDGRWPFECLICYDLHNMSNVYTLLILWCIGLFDSIIERGLVRKNLKKAPAGL